MKLIRVDNAQEYDSIPRAHFLPWPGWEEIAAHRPDAHWVALDADGVAAAACSLWAGGAPPLAGERVGAVGHYAASSPAAASALLGHACAELAHAGCTLAVGPMDGNTWRKYRFVTDRGDHPPFFLEPDQPDEWPRQFVDAGWTPLATYTSALSVDMAWEDPRLPRIAARMAADGVVIRPIDPNHYAEELERIYRLSLTSFAHNFLYTPIPRDEFLVQYRQVLPCIDPDLVLVAMHGDQLAGFLFSLPDRSRQQAGQSVDTFIVKTLAVEPGRLYAGLGSLLLARNRVDAARKGYRRAIHALMHDSNNSRNISDRSARTIRRYTLFGKALREP
ncbi:MAG: N-acetyltransferase family protein [Capsulimonadaceae bacterium]